jgi:hypothetical protein
MLQLWHWAQSLAALLFDTKLRYGAVETSFHTHVQQKHHDYGGVRGGEEWLHLARGSHSCFEK